MEGENIIWLPQNNTKKITKLENDSTYMDSVGKKNSPPSMTYLLSKWIDAYKKQTYLKDAQTNTDP